VAVLVVLGGLIAVMLAVAAFTITFGTAKRTRPLCPSCGALVKRLEGLCPPTQGLVPIPRADLPICREFFTVNDEPLAAT